ncbi:GNAT family N-acetyltransferase [Falsibacillus albus]|uniref:GNAT family N-acetyltransferase n=1 Tax=Falsibacillus albus TaxID=2478915 RepID=A0A3L7JNK8_9BACI|nr:GNAT family N-acetyltransferase [Falsibacillus albus]RLQ92408.1 GNAT family N-acetyltransferase [Falsibacillus albus]
MSTEIIPSWWETNRLIIEDMKKNEIQTVQQLYEQGSYINKWDGKSVDHEYAHRCFSEGDLPPDGIKEQYKIQVMCLKETDRIVGLLTSYHGYPEPDTFYINYLYIDKELHKQGIGQEVVNRLIGLLKEMNYCEVRANVAIKNWPAIRFWSKLGLNTINGVFGDRQHGDENFADIELIRQL